MGNFIKVIAAMMLLFTVNVTFSQTKEIDSLVLKLDNKDAYILLVKTMSPRIKGESAKRIVQIGKTATPDLIKILDSQNKGIIAHFILSEIWKENWEEAICCNIAYNGATEIMTINGLEILIDDDVIHANPTDLKANQKAWEKFWHV